MCPLAAAVAPTWEITLDEKVAQLSKRAMGDRITDGGRSQIIFAKVIDRQPARKPREAMHPLSKPSATEAPPN